MFARKTVASVLSTFNKVIADLDAIADREADKVTSLDQQVANLMDLRDTAMEEVADAIAAASRIRKLVEGE